MDQEEVKINILIPTLQRITALSITLTSLIYQTFKAFNIIISDQNENNDVLLSKEIQAIVRVLELHGQKVVIHHHVPRRGMAEQRQFLLNEANAPYCLFLDDDVILESDLIRRMYQAIQEEKSGFVGSALIGLSYLYDFRPREQNIKFWEGTVKPETVIPDSKEWERHKLHNAANMLHIQETLNIKPENQRKYHIAWAGGCVLYDTAKLRDSGGYNFWKKLPQDHSGEDVLAQLRVMKKYGGFGIIPSGAYHQEIPTTVENRETDAPRVITP